MDVNENRIVRIFQLQVGLNQIQKINIPYQEQFILGKLYFKLC
jgi:hypothetical protein